MNCNVLIFARSVEKNVVEVYNYFLENAVLNFWTLFQPIIFSRILKNNMKKENAR